MKVIKRGNKDMVREVECPKCGSILEYNHSDIDSVSHLSGKKIPIIICPVCGEEVPLTTCEEYKKTMNEKDEGEDEDDSEAVWEFLKGVREIAKASEKYFSPFFSVNIENVWGMRNESGKKEAL